jgi:hypothetical protein
VGIALLKACASRHACHRSNRRQLERRARRRSCSLLVCLLLHAGAAASHAASLASQFDSVIRFQGRLAPFPGYRRALESVVVGFQLNAVRTADYVATATTPGFGYMWDPETGSFRRTDVSRGSAFIEPAATIGAHAWYLSFAYLYSNFTQLDGKPLEESLDQLRNVRGPDQLAIQTRAFDFTSQVLAFSATYGITNRWDVNLLVPVFITTLRLDGTSALLVPGAAPFTNTFNTHDQTRSGIGDILLRTKYRLQDQLGIQMAAGFTLRVPSGDPDNFQGLGDVILTPAFIAQRAVGPSLLQANLGVEVNAGDVSQSRARYAVGATIEILHSLDFLVNVIGNSGFTDTHFTTGDVSGVVGRTDIVDAVSGVEIALGGTLVAQLGAIVPLTHDGLRATVVPVAWLGGRF